MTPEPGIILLEPTIIAMGVMVVTCAVAMPALSISVAITAPQRVLVPHVEVKITPSTPSSLSSFAIPCPIFFAFSRLVATPAVEYILLCN